MKKQWISVKCGLSRDPKHRQAMGESVWLFLHILDIASWEDGIAHEWKDEAAAEDMGMPVRTLREHRRRLDELGYITCVQKQYGQDIAIHNWTNPREYSGQTYNQKQGDIKREAQKDEQGYTQGYTQGYSQGNRKDVTPTSYSKNQITTTTATIFKTYQDNIGLITPMASVRLQEIVDIYPEGWFADATLEAVKNNKRNLGYIEAILKRWKADGRGDKRQSTKIERAEGQGFYA